MLARDETFDHRQVKTKAIFVLTQFVYTLVTCLPSMLLIYDNHAAHIAYGLIIFVAGIYNGPSPPPLPPPSSRVDQRLTWW